MSVKNNDPKKIAYLEQKLEDLILVGLESDRLYESSTEHLYKTLAQAYIDWVEFQKVPSFLETQYKSKGIVWRKIQSNEINFRPYIKLVFGLKENSATNNNKAGDWGAVLRELDRFYNEADADYFNDNALGKLINQIRLRGGVVGINKGELASGADDDDNTSPSDEKKLAKKKLSDDELALRSKTILTNNKSRGIGKALPSQHVRVDENNLVVMVGRREANGTITLLGTTNNDEAINAAAIHVAKRNMALVPYSIRQLAEILHTQMFPRIAIPKTKSQFKVWRDNVFYDETDIDLNRVHNIKKEDRIKDKNKATNSRRVVLRGKTGDVLLSSQRSLRSVVSICYPKISMPPKTTDIYLKTEERWVIEGYIVENIIELLSAKPEKSLTKVADQQYIYRLDTHNPFDGKKRSFHFYEQGRARDLAVLKTQTDFKFEEFVPIWKTNVEIDELLRLRADWLDEWFVTLGKNTQIKRENNFTFEVFVNKASLRIRYNMDPTNISPFFKLESKISLSDTRKEMRFIIRSKDIAPVIYNLCDMPVIGNIKISGDDDAIVFEFKTEIGDYRIAVPLFFQKKTDTKRIISHFYMYS